MIVASRGRVLIVDDDGDIRDVIAAALEVNGFEVQTMRDGIDALDLQDQYDAILLDVEMPVFDGQRLLDYWMVTNPTLLGRVVIMTGYSHRTWQPALPAFAIVYKPFEYDQLLHLVNQCVTHARDQAQREPSGSDATR